MSFEDSQTQHSNLLKRFFAIFEQSPFSIQVLSPTGYTIQVNKAWEKLWGVTLEQIKGYNILEDAQLEKKGIMPYIRRAFDGETVETPPVLYDPDETIPDVTNNPEPRRWTKANIYPIKDADGKVQEVVLIHEDITARKLAEEALRESESRYRSLLENANDIIYSHDLQGNYLSINQAGEKITGYTREEVLSGMNISQLVVPEQLELAKQMMERKLQDSSPTVYEVDVFAKDGRRLTLEVSTRISYREDVPVAVEGVARDITERKRSEQEKASLAQQIENQRKHLQEMVSSVPGVVWEAWGEPEQGIQQIDFVSDYVETMLGYSIEEWLSTPDFWLTIVHPDDKESAAHKASETFLSGKPGTNEFRWITKNGGTVWVESQSVAIYDESGCPVGMRGVTMDISQRKQKEISERFLAEASTTLASSLDYETTLSTVAQLAVPHFADWCSVDMVSSDGGALNRLAVAHIDPEKIAWAHEIYRSYPPDKSDPQGLYNVLRTGKSEFYPNIPDELLTQGARDEGHLEIMREIGFRSAMIVPLKVRESVLGVITFVNTGSRPDYTTEDLAHAEDLARRGALAVDNAQLFRAEQQTRLAAERTSEFLRRLQNVSSSLSQTLTAQEVSAAVIEHGVSSVGANAGTVALLDSFSEELEIVGSVGFPDKLIAEWKRFKLNQSLPIADAIRLKTPVLIESISDYADKYPNLVPLYSETKSKALVAFPLVVEGRTIGAIGLSFAEPQKFSEDDRDFLSALAHQCAQALERARLYETEQRLRAQAETANRMKDEFLATVSHELRTPLNAIIGWSGMLAANKLTPEVATRAIETIKRSAKSQAQIIEDLLDVSRIITGKLSLNFQWIELDSIIKTTLESLQPAADSKGVIIKSNFGSVANLIWGDVDRLQQVMWNLLSNAIKFTPSGGTVEVILESFDSHLQIVVSDTGEGISQKFLPFVFDRFSQADGTPSRKYGGLGLGLAIVRHLVEMHGGTVRAESAGENQGTTFFVNLPVRSIQKDVENTDSRDFLTSVDNSSLPISDSSSDLEGVRVLIIDDEEDARFLIKTMVEKSGATAQTVESVSGALSVLKHFNPHILISDIGMPEEDGYSLIRKVRALADKNLARIPSIALTAYAREEDKKQTLQAGFERHVAKPVDFEELIETVKNLVEIRN